MSIEDNPPPAASAKPKRSIRDALMRGGRQRCPACGEGSMFRAYLKVAEACPRCSEELHHQRADDAPPYFTMVIVGHVVIAGVLLLEKAFAPPSWVHLALWLPLTVLLSLWLLPRVKGALVGLQWALRMHGFGGATDETPERDLRPH
jgi:uncharacterized protein (DUF983 family)